MNKMGRRINMLEKGVGIEALGKLVEVDSGIRNLLEEYSLYLGKILKSDNLRRVNQNDIRMVKKFAQLLKENSLKSVSYDCLNDSDYFDSYDTFGGFE